MRLKGVIVLLQGLKVFSFVSTMEVVMITKVLQDFGAEVAEVKNSDYIVEKSKQRESNQLLISFSNKEDINGMKNLLNDADILIEDFQPGVMDYLGLGYEDLKNTNPLLVYCSITDFGQNGPYRDKASDGLSYLATAGLLEVNKNLEAVLSSPNDVHSFQLAVPFYTIVSIITAFFRKKGCRIDISRTECLIALDDSISKSIPYIEEAFPSQFYQRKTYGIVETLDQQYIYVGYKEEEYWDKLCYLLDLPHFLYVYKDQCVSKSFEQEMREIFKEKTVEEWLYLLNMEGIPCSKVNIKVDLIHDPQLSYRDILVQEEETVYVKFPAIFDGERLPLVKTRFKNI